MFAWFQTVKNTSQGLRGCMTTRLSPRVYNEDNQARRKEWNYIKLTSVTRNGGSGASGAEVLRNLLSAGADISPPDDAIPFADIVAKRLFHLSLSLNNSALIYPRMLKRQPTQSSCSC